MLKNRYLLTSLLLSVAAMPSFADVRINGFASIYGGQTLNSNDTLYSYTDEFDWQNDSLFAVQVSADVSEGLSATAQLIARGSEDFNAEFEWAYLTYEISDNAQLSAGKMRIPFYRYSDFLDVGYAYRWVRPPQSVYNLNFSTYEGLSYLYNSSFSDWDSSLQLIAGAVDTEFAAITDSDKGELKDTLGVNWTLTNGWFTGRVAYFVTETTIDASGSPELSGLLAGLQAYGLNEQYNNIAIDEDDSYFAAIGFGIDYNDFLVDAEYTQFEIDNSVLAKQTQYYVSVGYRMDSITLSATYEGNDDKNSSDQFNQVPRFVPGPGGNLIPVVIPGTNPPLYLQDATNLALASQASKSNSYSFTVRYDFHPAAAFKLEYTHFEDDLIDNDADLITFGVDLVF
ncbi:hypothetical protein OM33_15765 [Pseudoalteromonas piratica]|uniref:Porin domain-containing protein n=1 Tax=Pseudoalteromonas piratica TaxID=1348114 RepID=A0A0A7EJ17_9GAMM|nr:porin [Pseudoalteromonas piratica]AIY66599.1 hypothetical protein OM33_15765 [Pseudoalteromonas piratica]